MDKQVEKDRIIFHADCDGFFASVEETYHPEYREIPMAVAGNPENRHGIILAKNTLAKKAGIKTAETIWKAKQKCPDLFLCPPRHQEYSDFCNRINEIYENYTDQVERFSIDESFLDVTGSLHLFGGNPLELAHRIRREVQEKIDLTISIGVSYNKIFAKVGSDYCKPNNAVLITRNNYKQIIWPLPVSDLFMAGRKTCEELKNTVLIPSAHSPASTKIS